MTPTQYKETREREFDEVFTEVIGLETDPDGQRDALLIRDVDDFIEHSISLSKEKKLLRSFHTASLHGLLDIIAEWAKKADSPFAKDGHGYINRDDLLTFIGRDTK